MFPSPQRSEQPELFFAQFYAGGTIGGSPDKNGEEKPAHDDEEKPADDDDEEKSARKQQENVRFGVGNFGSFPLSLAAKFERVAISDELVVVARPDIGADSVIIVAD